jgi:hypothetical protein
MPSERRSIGGMATFLAESLIPSPRNRLNGSNLLGRSLESNHYRSASHRSRVLTKRATAVRQRYASQARTKPTHEELVDCGQQNVATLLPRAISME